MPKYTIQLAIDVVLDVNGLEAESDSKALQAAKDAFENLFTPANIAKAFETVQASIDDWNVDHTFQEEEASEEEGSDD